MEILMFKLLSFERFAYRSNKQQNIIEIIRIYRSM